MLSTRGRLALLLADMPGKWQDQFLRPGPWPAEFVVAMRETYLRAGPDFQLAKMTPRPLDLGPIATLTQFSRLPYARMVAIWVLFGLLLILLFYLHPPLSHATAPPTAPFRRAGDCRRGLAPMPRMRRGWRVFIFYSSAVLLTGLVSMLFADLLWRTGWSLSGLVLLCLFMVLFLLIAVGCMHGGFWIRRCG